jgi:DNA-binding Xre family transcriptional regulator
MCNIFSNAAFRLAEMDPKYSRLLEAARRLKNLENPAQIARALNMSEQRLTNWKTRGIPNGELNKICRTIGCHPFWLEDGGGDMIFNNLIDGDIKMAVELMQPMPEYARKAAVKELTQVSELISQAQSAGSKK